MSSNHNTLSDVSESLAALLSEATPKGWLIIAAEDLGSSQIMRTTLSYELGDFVTEIAGTGLPSGTIGVEFLLTLYVPEKVSSVGNARVSAEAWHLCRALDGLSDLVWTVGNRTPVDTGETTYRFPVTLLANYHTQP